MLPYLDNPIGKIALLVVGGGLTGSIYVVSPAIIGEFTPVSQRAVSSRSMARSKLLQAFWAPAVNGSVIENAATLLEGYDAGYRITALVQICVGLAGLLLLRPAAETARHLRLVPARTAA
jgi:MFS family permease